MTSRPRSLFVLAALVVVTAACGPGGDATTTTVPQAPTTQDPTTTTEAVPEAAHLSYRLEPGLTLTYEVEMDQHIEMVTSGDPGALGEEGLPGQMTMRVFGPATIAYAVSAGPEEGTFEIRVTGDVSRLEFSATVDGQPATKEDIPEFVGMEPIESTIIVDERGTPIVTVSGEESDPFRDLFAGLGGFAEAPATGLDPGRFFGPVLPEDEVKVGDTWTETIETPLLGAEGATTTVTSTLARTAILNGVDVLVIETTTTASEIRFDLGEMLLVMFQAFMPDDVADADLAHLEQLKEQLRFVFQVDPSESYLTSWFDPAAGVSRRAEHSGTGHMTIDMNLPDEATGEMVAFTMDMSVEQRMTYTLVDSSGA